MIQIPQFDLDYTVAHIIITENWVFSSVAQDMTIEDMDLALNYMDTLFSEKVNERINWHVCIIEALKATTAEDQKQIIDSLINNDSLSQKDIDLIDKEIFTKITNAVSAATKPMLEMCIKYRLMKLASTIESINKKINL